MKEYIKIPTYKNSACTEFYKYLYIVVLSNEAIRLVNAARSTFPLGDTTITSGITVNTEYLRIDKYGGSMNNSCLQAQVSAISQYRSNLVASLINPSFAFGNRDKFSLENFFSDNVPVYIKNGGRMVPVYTNTYSGSAHTGGKFNKVNLYVDHNTTSIRDAIFLEKGTDPGYEVNVIKDGDEIGASVTQQFTKTQAENVASAHRPWCCSIYPGSTILVVRENYSAVNAFPFLAFNITYSGLYYTSPTDNFPANQYRSWTDFKPSSTSAWATVLFGSSKASNVTTVKDAEVVQIQEDDENSYPGGGDDQNEYPEDGESGKGDFDNTNDPIDFPTLPTWDVQSTGFISLWRPTITQLTTLYAFLWDSDISTTLKKLFNEPMNAIFSLGIVPVDPVIQGTRHLTIGHVDTEIDMESIQKQFVTFDFGSIDINEYYGAAWDYSPYTQASIFLPYIGIQSVDIDDIMNCTLTLRYNIDILTGTTIALLKCVRKGRDNLNAVMYEWQGNCVTQCPITAGNWSQLMASVIQLGAMTGLALSQPVAGAIGNSPAMYGSTAGTKLAASASEYADGKNLVSPSMATFGALNVLGSKVHVQRGGRIDMSAGAMSMQKAYVILNRPVSGIPRGWNNYAGYPSLKIKKLGSQKGFVSVGAIKLDGLRATANEIGELDAILKAGVII